MHRHIEPSFFLTNKSERVGTVLKRSGTNFSSRISCQIREVAAEPIKPPETRGCRAADVPHGTTRGRRVCSSLGSRDGSSGRARGLSGGSDSGRVFWLWWAAGFWLRWARLNSVVGPRFVSVGREGFGSRVRDRFELRLPRLITREFFPATLSPSSVTSFRRPFSFIFESPPPPNPVYGVFLVRKGLTLKDLRGFRNSMFCLPYPTVYNM